jgi:hypothetical protein
MTTWNCAATPERESAPGEPLPSAECGVARAVGVLDCPQCGTVRAPFRENGEGPVFEFVNTSEPRFNGDHEAIGVHVRNDVQSGTPEVTERTEVPDNAEDQ